MTKEDYKERFASFFGESPDDNALSFMEDLTDTLEDLYNGVSPKPENGEKTYTEAEYKELDNKWRKKYTERFLSKVPDKSEEAEQKTKEEIENERLQNIKFEDLFDKK